MSPDGSDFFGVQGEKEISGISQSAFDYRDKDNQKANEEIKIYSGTELLKMDIPEPIWTIEGILPEGLAIIAGKPKVGKSLLVLNLAIAVATGGIALSKIPVDKGDVLYIALEDTLRRLKKRVEQMIPQDSQTDLLSRFKFSVAWPPMEQGGLKNVEMQIESLDDLRLIIIDTLALFRPQGVRKNPNLCLGSGHANQLTLRLKYLKNAPKMILINRFCPQKCPIKEIGKKWFGQKL